MEPYATNVVVPDSQINEPMLPLQVTSNNSTPLKDLKDLVQDNKNISQLNSTFNIDEVDDMNMSVASFGHSFLNQMSEDLDMGLVRSAISEREQKISELKADKLKLKGLLKKAKVAIDSISSKHKTVCEQAKLQETKLQHSQERVKELDAKVAEWQRRRSGMPRTQVA